MSKIPAAVTTLAEKLATGITIKVDKDTATVTVAEGQFLANLPENVTEENLKAVHEYQSTYYAAAAQAFGTAAIDTMKKHKKMETISAEFPLYKKDAFSVSVDRSKIYQPPTSDAPITAYGVLNAKLVTGDARANRGVIKHIREELSAAALAAFGEK